MAESSGPPDLLAIGHVTRDLVADRVVPGGAVTYGSLTARALGLTAAIVTSARPGDLEHTPGVDAHVVPSSATTTFRNLYRAGRRVQTIEAVAGPIAPDDVPASWRAAPHVLIAPLAREIDPAVARLFPGSVVVASIQGWLRRWDSDRVVMPRSWSGGDVLPPCRRRRSLIRGHRRPRRNRALGGPRPRPHRHPGRPRRAPPHRRRMARRAPIPGPRGRPHRRRRRIRRRLRRQLPRDPRPPRCRPLRIRRRQPLSPRPLHLRNPHPPPNHPPPHNAAITPSFLRRQSLPRTRYGVRVTPSLTPTIPYLRARCVSLSRCSESRGGGSASSPRGGRLRWGLSPCRRAKLSMSHHV